MKKEDQLVSLELSKKIDKLKFKQDSNFYWQKLIKGKSAKWELVSDMNGEALKNALIKNYVEKQYRAYSVAELGEILPIDIKTLKSKEIIGNYVCVFDTYEGFKENDWKFFDEKTEANARAKMAIYLRKNKLI